MSIENECGNKRAYATKAAAKLAEKHLRTVAGGSRQHCYRCAYCDAWHCGHGTARLDESVVVRDTALRIRANDLLGMILREREALETAQTPTQVSYYTNRVAEFEKERAEALDAIGCLTLEEAV
jgi:hypothetical protein